MSGMVKNATGIYAGSKITHAMRSAIEHAIAKGSYLNTSNFIRDAIKEKLQREGFIAVKESGERISETKL
jgi:Arc/MetJ-type ribon-helix-helix transcriptional regulator